MNAIEIKSTPAHYSVALGRRPVNHFQTEAAANFRNNNGSGFQAPWPRNAISKIAISARRFIVLRDIQPSESIRETKPIENAFHANPW